MLDITKYYSEDELKKVKSRRLIESSAKALSNDDVYNQSLIEGGIGVEPTMKLIMDQAMGKETTPLQMYHNVSSSGMQAI